MAAAQQAKYGRIASPVVILILRVSIRSNRVIAAALTDDQKEISHRSKSRFKMDRCRIGIWASSVLDERRR